MHYCSSECDCLQHSPHNLPCTYTDEYFAAAEQEENVVPIRGVYLKLPNTGSSLSSSFDPLNPINPVSDSLHNKFDTLGSTKSSDSSSLLRTLPKLSKKQASILRPLLRKKTKVFHALFYWKIGIFLYIGIFRDLR